MIQHILLAILTGLLAFKYDKPNEKFLRYLWVFNSLIWTINIIEDVINLIV